MDPNMQASVCWPQEAVDAQPLPAPDPATAPPAPASADDSWSSSGPEPVKRPCFAPASKMAASPRGMGDYFFDPQSPEVSREAADSSLLAPPCFPTCSSPSASPGLRSDASALPDASGVFSHAEVGPTVSPPCMRIATAPTPEMGAAAAAEAQADESDDALMLGGSMPALHCGSPVRASQRKSRPMGCGTQRSQTTMGFGGANKENDPPAAAHVSPGVPGFGSFEMDSKTLPCFPVKSDGLMRITPDTMRDVLHGKYDEQICGFQVVDCRFAYEYEGGHIAGALNLNTVEQVQQYFLTPGTGLHAQRAMPMRTQSGMPDATGDTRKFLLIFHCEFSWKRGPSMALALRAADRSLAGDYPRCHFPDVYVLQGGYADFFKACPELCRPRAYVAMDDPRFLRRRSEELVGFRKQFVRNRSFAYGDEHYTALSALSARVQAQGAPRMLAPQAPAPAPRPHVERDASFSSAGDSSFEADASCSPCAAATHRRPTQADDIGGGLAPPTLKHAFARRPLARAETMPTASRVPHASGTAHASPMRP